MAKQKKYKVTNTTIKPARICPKTGKDLRKAIEKIGHGVSFRDDKNNQIILHARANPRFVDSVNDGMWRLHQGGLIKVEEVSDVVAELKNHTLERNVKAPSLAQQELQDDGKRRASATEMGKQDYNKEPETQSEYPGAVNPDGPNNFTVRAGRKTKTKPETTDLSLQEPAAEEPSTGV